VVLFVSVVVAIGLAIMAVRHERQIARSRLVFESLTRKNWDGDYLDTRMKFTKLCEPDDMGLAKYIEKQPDYAVAEMVTVRAILNDHEIMAIGIRQGILDEEYLFRYMRGIAIRDWNRCVAFVTALRVRTQNPLLYVEFEGLATSWQNNRSYYGKEDRMPHRVRRVSVS
ncbi:MAG: DUF4760 domain-containing protein, partial [Methyloceanibacter sp.]